MHVSIWTGQPNHLSNLDILVSKGSFLKISIFITTHALPHTLTSTWSSVKNPCTLVPTNFQLYGKMKHKFYLRS